MNTLSIDVETFSDVDISKCGAYKYAESPSFEILLFAYAADGGEVQVVDLAAGEKIPQEILAALTDDNVIKWAFNANFERICLSRYLSDVGFLRDAFLSPESWHCTMVWAAYMGLPLSLAAVGSVLGLEEQKMSEGKSLIRYFCTPCTATKTNGGRVRNLPCHAPDKWAMFKAYNKRDVKVEMAIQHRLAKFPVPNFLWDEYHLDQAINDRGIRIDMAFVDNAIAIDARSRDELSGRMKQLTGLDNPNSVQTIVPEEHSDFTVRTAPGDFPARTSSSKIFLKITWSIWKMSARLFGGKIFSPSTSSMILSQTFCRSLSAQPLFQRREGNSLSLTSQPSKHGCCHGLRESDGAWMFSRATATSTAPQQVGCSTVTW